MFKCTNSMNSVMHGRGIFNQVKFLEEFRVSRLAVIQEEISCSAFWRWV